MTVTPKRVAFWIVCVALLAGLCRVGPEVRAADPAAPEQVASVEQLKAQAIAALRAGKFEQTNDFLAKAAAASSDPSLTKMAGWTRQFEDQWQGFVAERRKEYQKAVADVHLLLKKEKHLPYAMEVAVRAHLLADDKDAFRKEAWIVKLLGDAAKLADVSEKNEDWLRALRLYSQLGAIELDVPQWKEKLKIATRRIRVMALYAPEEFEKIRNGDSKEREEVEAILRPTTQPAAKAATPEDEAEEALNRINWRDTLRGVRMDMLRDALLRARDDYFREVSYQRMLLGGLNSLRVVLTTPALEHAKGFEGFKNVAKRSQFLGFIDANIAKLEKTGGRDDQEMVIEILKSVREQNEATIELPEEALVSEFADGAFAMLDEFSNILWPSDWEELQKDTRGEFSGVGIQIQRDDLGNLKVVTPLEDSPAYKAGIKPDWIVTHIDGKSAKWVNINQAVKRITGPAGTPVVLTIKDVKGLSKDYKLVRDTIKVASVKGWLHKPGGGWDYMIDPEQRIGYLRLTRFSRTTSEDLNKAVAEMQKSGATAIIMDLRYNGGGLLPAAIDVVDKFISEGTIVSTRPDRASPNQPTVAVAHRQFGEVKLPVVVLVNQLSASASEIVSGALKDHKRALIVGERTFGKGSVQMLYQLGGESAVLKLTTSHYYLPNGKCIHREENSKDWGVDPDITVEMTPEQMRAALDARLDSDILRDAEPGEVIEKVAAATAKKAKDPLSVDPQLSAALLLLRLQLAGAQL
jgi:carboxyl-terminal processing protease